MCHRALVTVVTGVIIWVRHAALKKEAIGPSKVNAFGGVRKYGPNLGNTKPPLG